MQQHQSKPLYGEEERNMNIFIISRDTLTATVLCRYWDYGMDETQECFATRSAQLNRVVKYLFTWIQMWEKRLLQ
jgi:hypothetical protein